jgi:hypothetical protein
MLTWRCRARRCQQSTIRLKGRGDTNREMLSKEMLTGRLKGEDMLTGKCRVRRCSQGDQEEEEMLTGRCGVRRSS